MTADEYFMPLIFIKKKKKTPSTQKKSIV